MRIGLRVYAVLEFAPYKVIFGGREQTARPPCVFPCAGLFFGRFSQKYGYANTGLSEWAHHTINSLPPIRNYVYMGFHVNFHEKSDMGI